MNGTNSKSYSVEKAKRELEIILQKMEPWHKESDEIIHDIRRHVVVALEALNGK